MAGGNATRTITLDFKARIDDAQKKLQALSKMNIGNNKDFMTKNLQSALIAMSRLQKISEKGIFDAASIKQAEKEFKVIDNCIDSLVVKLDGMKGKNFSDLMAVDKKPFEDTSKQITKIKEDLDKVNQLQKKVNREKGYLKTTNDPKKIDNHQNQIAQAQAELAQIQQSIQPVIDKIIQEYAKYGVTLTQADLITGKFTKAQGELQDKLRANVNSDVDNATSSVKEYTGAMKESANEVHGLGKAIDEENKAMSDTSALKSRIENFFSLTNAMMLVRRVATSAVQSIKELDKAMTDIAVVSDYSVGDMWKQLPQFADQANKLGASITDAYEATTLFVQQGLELNTAAAMSTETLKMARIAGIDAANATDAMTAALHGFNMELNEASAERVNDVYSQLAAHSASNVQELSTAMTKTASIASSANMEFENTAAFLAQIIETTREGAETAGTALKTVIARFSEVKTLYNKGEFTGSDEEGQAIDVNKVAAALNSVGISMNKFFVGEEGLDSIFMKLAAKWDSLDTVTQRYIATMAAGSRQQSRFIALMSNYNRTVELTTMANNAAGASNEQFNKTLESVESKVNKLKNAWQQFTMGLLNSDLVKAGIDTLTFALESLNKVIDTLSAGGKLGGVKSILSAFAAVGIFKVGKSAVGGLSGALANLFGGGNEGLGGMFGRLEKNLSSSGEKMGEILIASITKGFGKSAHIVDSIKSLLTMDIKKGLKGVGTNFKGGNFYQLLFGEISKGQEAKQNISENLLNKILKADPNDKTGMATKGLAKVESILGKIVGKGPQIATIFGIIAAGVAAGILIEKAIVTVNERLDMANEKAKLAAENLSNLKSGYEEISTAISSVTDKQDALDDMVKGTTEWTAATAELNTEITKLAAQYPQLSKYISSKNGVLSLDENGVQEVLEAKEAGITTANIASLNAQKDVANAQLAVDRKEFVNNFRVIWDDYKEEFISGNQIADLIESGATIDELPYADTYSQQQKQAIADFCSSISVANSSINALDASIADQIAHKLKIPSILMDSATLFAENIIEKEGKSSGGAARAYGYVKVNTHALQGYDEELGSETEQYARIYQRENNLSDEEMENISSTTIKQWVDSWAEEQHILEETRKQLDEALALAGEIGASDFNSVARVMSGKKGQATFEDYLLASSGAFKGTSFEENANAIKEVYSDYATQLGQYGLSLQALTGTKMTANGIQKMLNKAKGKEDGAEYIKGALEIINDVNNKDNKGAVANLLVGDIEDATQAVTTYQQLIELGVDGSKLEDFWDNMIDKSEILIKNETEAFKLIDQVRSTNKSNDELEDALKGGSASSDQVADLITNGWATWEDFVATADGYYATAEKTEEILAKKRKAQVLSLQQELKIQKELNAMIKGGKASSILGINGLVQQTNDGYALSTTYSNLGEKDQKVVVDTLKALGLFEEVNGETDAERTTRIANALDTLITYLNNGDNLEAATQASLGLASAKIQSAGQVMNNSGDVEAISAAAAAEASQYGVEFESLSQSAEHYKKVLEELGASTEAAKKAGWAFAASNARIQKSFDDICSKADQWRNVINQGLTTGTAYTDMIYGMTDVLIGIAGLSEEDAKYLDDGFIQSQQQLLLQAQNDKTKVDEIQKNVTLHVLVDKISGLDEDTQKQVTDIWNSLEEQGVFDVDGVLSGEMQTAVTNAIQYLLDLGVAWDTIATAMSNRGVVLHLSTEFSTQKEGMIKGGAPTSAIEAYEKEQVVNSIESIFGDGLASSGLSSSGGGGSEYENKLDRYYNEVKRLEKTQWRLTQLQKEYNKLTADGALNVEKTQKAYEAQLANLNKQKGLQQEMYNLRMGEVDLISQKYAKYKDYVSWDSTNNTVKVDWSLWEGVKDSDFGKKLDEAKSAYEQVQKQIEEAADALYEIEDQIKQLKEKSRDQYIDLVNQANDALISQQQKLIDEQEKTNKAIDDARKSLTDAIKTNIDKMRQDRQNAKTEEELAEKRRRLAYLKQDTSGSNAVAIKQLEKELSEAEQDHQDELVDQAISKMEEVNDAAAEQRSEQIELAQSQLDQAKKTGAYIAQAEQMVKDSYADGGVAPQNSELWKLLYEQNNYAALSYKEQMKLLDAFTGNVEEASNIYNSSNYMADAQATYKKANGNLNDASRDELYEIYLRRLNKTGQTQDDYSFETFLQDVANGSSMDYMQAMLDIYNGAGDKLSQEEKDNIYRLNNARNQKIIDNPGMTEKGGAQVKQYTSDEMGILNELYNRTDKKVKKFKTGGLADYTGPAWLDGTSSKPELVLNAEDTQNFLELKNVLARTAKANGGVNGSQGNVYMDVDIKVDEISSDYDVDRLVDRVKEKITESTSYRNVNVVRTLR